MGVGRPAKTNTRNPDLPGPTDKETDPISTTTETNLQPRTAKRPGHLLVSSHIWRWSQKLQTSLYTPNDYTAKPTLFKLRAANGSAINTYGERTLTLNIGVRRDFTWIFTVSNVKIPILGADYALAVHMNPIRHNYEFPCLSYNYFACLLKYSILTVFPGINYQNQHHQYREPPLVHVCKDMERIYQALTRTTTSAVKAWGPFHTTHNTEDNCPVSPRPLLIQHNHSDSTYSLGSGFTAPLNRNFSGNSSLAPGASSARNLLCNCANGISSSFSHSLSSSSSLRLGSIPASSEFPAGVRFTSLSLRRVVGLTSISSLPSLSLPERLYPPPLFPCYLSYSQAYSHSILSPARLLSLGTPVPAPLPA
ncbi:unnamed protein product [Acanthosepion pharaonis]|uniref:Uncharacterized protein n=1 Tax=Acanthosepion pharaonis TaxID=158019 RepID=A0A812CMN8_ACAPH|nr:unnamed protein product [Sepia pharaonis]